MSREKLFHLVGLLLIVLLLLVAVGCGAPEEEAGEEQSGDEPAGEEEAGETENGETAAEGYFYPRIFEGTLRLSTGEVITGINPSESVPGFTHELTPDYTYNGELKWIVTENDPLAVEWAELTFEVEDHYLEETDEDFMIEFNIRIEDFFDNNPASGPGINSYELDIVENVRGFEIAISRITLGKQQESTEGKLIDFVALEVQMRNTR
ncbi:MAG TPA: hypothetical protein PLY40_08510 [Bacillota bacterium]|nr:hypothetical protein [Bacillota bacterium]